MLKKSVLYRKKQRKFLWLGSFSVLESEPSMEHSAQWKICGD